MEIFNNMNEEAQELVEIFNKQLGELSADGNTKVVAAFITLSHIMGKEIQILREEHKCLLVAMANSKPQRSE